MIWCFLVDPTCKCEKLNNRAFKKVFSIYRKLKKFKVKRSIEEAAEIDANILPGKCLIVSEFESDLYEWWMNERIARWH